MAQIRETLTLEDRFSATFTRFLQLGEKAAGASQRAANASQNYQTVLNRMDQQLITLNAQFASATQEQNAMLAAGQRNSSAFAALDARMERLGGTIRDLTRQYDLVEKEADQAAAAAKRFDSQNRQVNASASSLTGTLGRLAGTFLGMQSVKWLTNTSDQLTQTNARLKLMTGSAEAAAEANDQIFAAAMRSRGAYADMADTVAKLGTLAPNAFTDTGEIIAFAEQLQKQMARSGTSTQSAQAAMLQLTQGLSSGVLRGEELNSVLDQTPLIAKTIADYMGVTIGEMRELASEGKVTADVVKNAILGATAETNAQFEQMPMTWAQVWTMAQNIAIRALDPVLQAISWLANNIETVGPIVLSLGAAFAVFLVAANWTNICTAATTGLATAQKMLGAVMATTWGLPLIIIALVIGAIYAVTAAVNHFAGTSVSATGIIAGVVMTALAVVGNLFVALFNLLTDGWVLIYNLVATVANFIGNVFIDPVGSVARLFFGLADTVLGVLQAIASAIDTVFGFNLSSSVQGWRDSLGGWVDKTFGQGTEVMAKLNANDLHLGRFEYGAAFGTGYNWGANLFSGSSAGGYDLSAAYTPYNEISGQLDDISGSVGSIEKSVKMTDEDIKSLVDVAERRYVNNVNLTAQTPVITVNGQNTGHTAADRQNLANAIRDILIEQRASGSTRSTARPTTG